MVEIAGFKDAQKISLDYGIPVSEILFCELNRTGVFLQAGQVPVSFRTRFLCDEIFSPKPPMYFAVPVRESGKTRFMIDRNGNLMLGPSLLGRTTDIEVDTCDCSYFRKDKKVLNLNSNQRGKCGGCKFCVHNYPLYDLRVLKDRQKIRGKSALRKFFEEEIIVKNGFMDLRSLEQIAIVTGLFGKEKLIVEHIADIREVASEFQFSGTIFFLGFELMSKDVLAEIKNYGPFSLCYSVDCLTKRKQRLVGKKGEVPIITIIQTLERALEYEFEVTFSYVVGLDPLSTLQDGISELSKVVNRFPIVNIYQIQHPDQRKSMLPEAYELDYYLQARKIFETIFCPSGLKPHNWENYRSLWYHYIGSEYIPE